MTKVRNIYLCGKSQQADQNGKLISGTVEYLNKSGKSFVSKSLQYKYSAAPDYRLVDKRSG